MASAVMQALYMDLWSEARVLTERMRLRKQAVEMSFLPWVAGLIRRDWVRCSDIRRELGV